MKVTIVGVSKREGKGKVAINYFGLKDFGEYEKENTVCEGQAVVTEFSYTDYDLHVGDVVEFDYEPGYQGRAKLSGIRMVSSAGSVPAKESKDGK